MGEKRRRDEFAHKSGVVAQFEVRHHHGNSLRLFQEVLGEGEKPCPQQGAISDKDKFFDIHLRKKTDENRLLQVEVATEAACNDDLLDVFEGQSDAIQQNLASGIHGRFGADQILDVDFVQDDVLTEEGLLFSRKDALYDLAAELRRPIDVVDYTGELDFGIGHLSAGQRRARFPDFEIFRALWESERTVWLVVKRSYLAGLQRNGLRLEHPVGPADGPYLLFRNRAAGATTGAS